MFASSSEKWLSDLNGIVRRYRDIAFSESVSEETKQQALEAATKEFQKMGMTSGDAQRYLKPHLRGH